VTVRLDRALQAPPVSTAASARLVPEDIERLPYFTRNVLEAVTFLPGVDTTTLVRRSTVAGLPPSALSIELDGVNIQDNDRKTREGFFALVTPRQDAMGEVTVTSATPPAALAGQGAVHIQFVTRSGTSSYLGSGVRIPPRRAPEFELLVQT